MFKSKTHEEFMEKFNKTEVSKNTEILGQYINKRTKIKCKCKICGREFEIIAGELLRKDRKYGCKLCSAKETGKNFILTNEEFLKRFKEKGNKNVKIIGEYINGKTQIECECLICGKNFYRYPGDLLKGFGHQKRNCTVKIKHINGKFPHTLKEFLEFVKPINKEKFIIYDYIGNSEPINLKCKRCGHIFTRIANALWHYNTKCPNCNSVNFEDSIAGKRPDLIKYFEDPEKAKWYTVSYNKKLELKCPNCRQIIYQTGNNFTTYGFHCPYCSSTLSIGNKLIRALCFYLKENNLIKDFELEYKPNKTRYPYDAYIILNNEQKILCECQGRQHYPEEEVNSSMFHREEIFKNDKIKKQYALDNNYIFVEIDCKESDFIYIKNNMIKEFENYIEMNNIDWNKVYDKMNDTNLVNICNYYEQNKDIKTFKQIAEDLKISKSALRNKLKTGYELGLTTYQSRGNWKTKLKEQEST